MKRHLKYLIPFLALFFIIPLSYSVLVSADETTPYQNWGIQAGDEIRYTMGWSIGFDLEDSGWDMLDSYLGAMGGPPGFDDARGHYENFSKLDSVYHFKIEIIEMVQDLYEGSSFDRSIDIIIGEMTFKSVEMNNYGPINNTFLYELQQNAEMFDYYSSLFGWGVSSSELISEFTSGYPGYWNTPYNQYWYNYNTNYPEEPSYPGGYPLFIPKDWSCANFYEFMQSQYDEDDYDYYSNVFGTPINSWNDLTAAVGFTRIAVNRHEVTIKAKLSSVNENLRDDYVDSMGLYNPDTAQPIDTYAELLAYLEVTNFNIEMNIHAEWSLSGILENFHAELVIDGDYEGDHFKILPEFDISKGEHSSINSRYIPGFSIYLVILAAVSTVSVIAIRIKKKKA